MEKQNILLERDKALYAIFAARKMSRAKEQFVILIVNI